MAKRILKDPRTMVIDRKTGKPRKKDMQRSKIMKAVARRRKRKKMPMRQRAALSKTMRMIVRTGRTTTGRKARMNNIKKKRFSLFGNR